MVSDLQNCFRYTKYTQTLGVYCRVAGPLCLLVTAGIMNTIAGTTYHAKIKKECHMTNNTVHNAIGIYIENTEWLYIRIWSNNLGDYMSGCTDK